MDIKEAKSNSILKCITGSRAYGTNNENSDWDTRGIFIAHPENIITPYDNIEQIQSEFEDTLYYEFKKFMSLIVDQNPNILELLWVNQDKIISQTNTYRLLRDHRDDLLSQKCAFTFSGYAMSQLKRIKGHNKWINNPQDENIPEQKDFTSVIYNFTEDSRHNNIPLDMNDHIAVRLNGNMFMLYDNPGHTWIANNGNLKVFNRKDIPEHIELKNKHPKMILNFNDDEFKRNVTNWKNYWNWKTHRNEKRGELEEKFGFDTKHAMHLIRLLRMGDEIINEGVVKVERPDAKELLDIRNGLYSYEYIIDEATRLDEKIQSDIKNCSLAKDIDRELAKDIMMEIYEEHWKVNFPRKRKSFNKKSEEERVVVLDTECTGEQKHNKKMIIEVGAIEIINGKITSNIFHSYVNPEAPVSKYARDKIHGLDNDFLENFPTFPEIYEDLIEFIGNSPVVGHSISSDLKHINHDINVSNLSTPFKPKSLGCTFAIAKMLGFGDKSLDNLAHILNVSTTVRKKKGHGALLDAKITGDVFLKMVNNHNYEGYLAYDDEKKKIKNPNLTSYNKIMNFETKKYYIKGNIGYCEYNGKIKEIELPETVKGYRWVVSKGKKGKKKLICIDYTGHIHNPIGPSIIKYMPSFDEFRLQSTPNRQEAMRLRGIREKEKEDKKNGHIHNSPKL